MNWGLVILGAIVFGTGIAMMIRIFPQFGGKAGPWVLMGGGFFVMALGAILPLAQSTG
jgi:inosine-uridine nucleoside N-ribohydrolase